MRTILKNIIVVTLLFISTVSQAGTDTFYCDLDSMLNNTKTIGLLYEVRYPGVPHSYLFGSAHLGYKRFSSLPQGVKNAIAQTDHFYLEHISKSADATMLDDFNFLADGKDIESVLKPSTYKRLLGALRDAGFTEDRIINNRNRTPIFFATFVQPEMPLFSNFSSLDSLVVADATARGLAIQSLENEDSVMSGYRQITNSDWSDYLETLIDIKKSSQKLISEKQFHYCEFESIRLGDTRQMEENELDSRRLRPVQNKISMLLRKSRNQNQAIGIREKMIENNGVNFFAVGARHLVGDDSVVELLMKEGFEVRQLK